ncbi:hypothetical protein HKX42_11445, partial [Salinisphaera sp. USBA-960]|nr:hypothetical protein [Salifodinibacter halophilus]
MTVIAVREQGDLGQHLVGHRRGRARNGRRVGQRLRVERRIAQLRQRLCQRAALGAHQAGSLLHQILRSRAADMGQQGEGKA